MKQRILLTSAICIIASSFTDATAAGTFNVLSGGTLKITRDYSNAVVRKNYGTVILSENARLGGGISGMGVSLTNGSQIELKDNEPICGETTLEEDTASLMDSDGSQVTNVRSIENQAGKIVQKGGYVGTVNNYSEYYYGGGTIGSFNQQSDIDNNLSADDAILHIINNTTLTLKQGNYINNGVVNVGFTDDEEEDTTNGKLIIDGDRNSDGTVIDTTELDPERPANLETGAEATTLNLLNDQYLDQDEYGKPIEESWTGGILEIKSGKVILDGSENLEKVNWVGDVYLKGGELTLRNIIDDSSAGANGTRYDEDGKLVANKGGELIATGGTLILDEHVVLNEQDTISPEVKLIAKKGVTFGEGSSIVLDKDDAVTGEITVTGGELISQGFATNENTYVNVSKGGLNVRAGENEGEAGFTMNNEKDFIAGDCTSKIEAPIHVNNGTFHLNDMVDPTSEQENIDTIESEMTVSGGQFIGKSILIKTNDTRKYNQTGGTTYLTDSILNLRKGSKITGSTIIHDAVDFEQETEIPEEKTPEVPEDKSAEVENKGNMLLGTKQENSQNKQVGLKMHTLTTLQAPVRRINAAKAVGKTIALKDVKDGDTQLALDNGEDNDAKVVVPAKENGIFEIVVQGNNGEQLADDPVDTTEENTADANKATTFTLNRDSKVERGHLVVGDGINENKINLADNAEIGKNATLNIKENASLNVNGSESKVTIDLNNDENQINGEVVLNIGTLAFTGDLDKALVKAEGEVEKELQPKKLKTTKNKLQDGLGEGDDDEGGDGNKEQDAEPKEDEQDTETEEADGHIDDSGFGYLAEAYKVKGGELDLTETYSGNLKADDEHQIEAAVIKVGENDQVSIKSKGFTNELKNSGKVQLDGATVKSIEFNKNTNTGEEKGGTVTFIGTKNTVNGAMIQENTYIDENSNLAINNGCYISTAQSANIKGNILFNGGNPVLSVNEKGIKGRVTVGKNNAPTKLYFTSGEIGAVTIGKGSAIVITHGRNEAITGEWRNKIKNDVGGRLIIERDDVVEGDIYLYQGAVIIKKNLEFGNLPTYENANAQLPYFKQYGGKLTIDGVTVKFGDVSVLFGDPDLLNGASVTFGESSISTEESVFTGNVNTINGLYEQHGNSDRIKIGNNNSTQADFSIDVYGRSKETAKFDNFGKNDGLTVMSPTNGNSANVNIADFALNGDLFGDDAPIDKSIPMKIFNVSSSNGITFTSSGTEKLTAIGYYALKPTGNGNYNLELTKFNPGVFRDQIGMTALSQNQTTLNDGVFSHILANNKAKSLDYIQGNKNQKNKNVWVKLSGGHEKLHLNTGDTTDTKNENTKNNDNSNTKTNELPDITNNSYSALLGFNFDAKSLSANWMFTPTIFAGYMGANQKYEIKDTDHQFKSRQDGGEIGFAGSFGNGKWSIGTMVYGGYFRNKVTLPNGTKNNSNNNDSNDKEKSNGNTEKINHGLFGAAIRLGYNINLSQNVVIQPNLSSTYNYISGGNWKTTYGNMDMISNKLNGFSILPGLDLIFTSKQSSIVLSLKYVLSINNSGTGKAGNVELPKLKMKKKGYMQYGFGLNFISTKNLIASIQATFRHLGSTGFGGQFKLSWKF